MSPLALFFPGNFCERREKANYDRANETGAEHEQKQRFSYGRNWRLGLKILRLGKISGRSARPVVEGHLQDLRGMERHAISGLPDLLATTKTVGHNQSVFRLLANSRQQRALAAGDRHIVVLLLKSKSARHSTATSLRFGEVDPHLSE